MKNKLEHIDKLFLEGAASDAVNFSAKKGWRGMKIRLLLSEIMALNFVNVNWGYLIFAGLFLLLFSLSFIYFNSNEIPAPEMGKTISTETVFPETEKNSHQILHESSQTETHKITEVQAPQQTSPIETGLSAKNAQSNTAEKQQERFNIAKQPSNSIVSNAHGIYRMPPKKYSGQLSLPDEPSSTATRTLHPEVSANLKDMPVTEKQESRPSPFLLGFNTGSVFLLNENNPAEEIQKPILFAGLSLRYNRPHFYIETAVEFSYYESVLHSTYRYDSVLGTIASSGYDIVEVTNDDGEVVLERQYRSELVTVYDTLSSDDEVAISGNAVVLCIPLSVGTRIFQHGNFYTSIFAGAVFKMLLNKNQSLPEYGTENRKILTYETDPVISYEPEFYFQAGLLFGYDISKSFSLEIQSSYNHILGGNSNVYQSSTSNIRAGIGLNFKF
jgi:hypothetical protein